MDGVIFLYIHWLLWVIYTFFVQRTKKRLSISAFLLISILAFGLDVPVGKYTINGSALIIFGYSFLILARSQKQIVSACMSLAVAIAYCGALFFESVSPIWIIGPRLWMLSFLAFALVYFMSRFTMTRIGIWGIGAVFGETLFTTYINELGYEKIIGNPMFLDIYAVVLLFFTIAATGSFIIESLEGMVSHRIKRKVGVKP
ncbi:hypothetical protein ACFFGV_05955 [Pontibacillus salicampi]|uniref:Integral membrane protein n=1 Tax=Pontibacillus salicampi TaxID=1449801 RepID=A0ABV6LLG7_9BACI